MRSKRFLACAGLALGVTALAISTGFAQPSSSQPEKSSQPANSPANPPTGQPGSQPGGGGGGGGSGGGGLANMGQILAGAIRSVDGCLGVDLAETQSGKNVIIGWFKDAESARNWYRHPVHQRMMGRVNADAEAKQPLEHVPDGIPVMVVATITFAERPMIEGIPMPISQISIELYTPLPGGAAINGRLAPDSMPVQHMNMINP